MSYTDRNENWWGTETQRNNRLVYTSIIGYLSHVEGLSGHELRVAAAKHFRALSN